MVRNREYGDALSCEKTIASSMLYSYHHMCINLNYGLSGLIVDRINKLAHDINEDYHGETLHILCVLKGKEGRKEKDRGECVAWPS